MARIGILDDEAFSLSSLTATANNLPFVPGQVGASGLFEDSDSVATTTVEVEVKNNSLSLVASSARGASGETVAHDKASVVGIRLGHFQRNDTVMADEVQNVRAFGKETELETVESLVERKIARHTRDLDTTIEHLRVGAIKGIVVSKNATLVNLFTTFGVSALADQTWNLSDAAFKVRDACQTAIFTIEDELEATNYTRIRGFAGRAAYRALTGHKEVRETFLNTQQASQLRGQPANTFEYGDILFERYKTGTKAKAANGNTDFIADNEIRLVVEGVPSLFIERYGPADYEETVNTLGLPRYASQYPRQDKKGRELEVQTNPIMICTQPRTLLRIVIT